MASSLLAVYCQTGERVARCRSRQAGLVLSAVGAGAPAGVLTDSERKDACRDHRRAHGDAHKLYKPNTNTRFLFHSPSQLPFGFQGVATQKEQKTKKKTLTVNEVKGGRYFASCGFVNSSPRLVKWRGFAVLVMWAEGLSKWRFMLGRCAFEILVSELTPQCFTSLPGPGLADHAQVLSVSGHTCILHFLTPFFHFSTLSLLHSLIPPLPHFSTLSPPFSH